MVDDVEHTLSGVGAHLRALRQERDMTLTELAASTGISLSTLSRLESGSRRPALELLLPLARVYGVTLDDLVDAPDTADPRVHMRPVVHHGITTVPLSRRGEGIQAFKMLLPGHEGPALTPDPQSHFGYEWLYVLDGRLRLVLGTHELVMEAGEAAEFDTRTPHWFGAADDEPVELLCLVGKQGERAHLRARPKRATA